MQESLASFYRDQCILVTGHTGFKGGWLSLWLQAMGARVIGFSLPVDADRPSLFEAVQVVSGMDSRIGDVRNLDAVVAAFGQTQPKIVFHNAAQALVLKSYRDPVETYATNVMGTVHVLEAARQTPSVRAVVVVTSDKCYENREWPWGYREQDPMGGHDPYSSSKGCAELVTAAYRRSFFPADDNARIASARAGNIIGGGDWAQDRIVPDIVRGIASGEPTVVRHPNSVRPWQHVLEPLRGYLTLGRALAQRLVGADEPWNFGPSEENAVTVADLANAMVTRWGQGRLSLADAPRGPHEAQYLKLDCGKSRSRLGWRPVLDFQTTIELTVDWYRNHLQDPQSARDFTLAQIQKYQVLTDQHSAAAGGE